MPSDAAVSWPRLSRLVADTMGLHFPPERWLDLQRGMAGAAAELGFTDVAACADRLLSAPLTRQQLQVLASHLTVGETYFFRDRKTFEVLAESVLPELIRSRRGRDQRLRLWSAGCCSGEEAYSLAILLRQLLPDLANWRVTILATDITARFLQKAVAASYGAWSFRDTPPGIRERYFDRGADGHHVVIPEIRDMVTFAHLNLAEDIYPSPANDTTAMDVIFCRNVLMYFAPVQTLKVIEKLQHALVDGGWLAVSPSESSQTLFRQFATQNFPGVVLYRKGDAKDGPRDTGYVGTAQAPGQAVNESADWFAPTFEAPPPWAPPILPAASAEWAPPRAQEEPVGAEPPPTPSATAAEVARALADQGRLAEALTWCDRWIAADKVDAAGHYLRAMVLQEQGDLTEARRSLQRAVYLDPDFVLAHYALGFLVRDSADPRDAGRHFDNAMRLLTRHPPDAPLPESDGLTAGRLTETITALIGLAQLS